MMDLACLIVGTAFGVLFRFGHDEMAEYVYGHIDGWCLLFGGVLLANYLAGSYKLQYTFSRFNLIVTWLFSLLFAVLILSITSFAWFRLLLGRGVLALVLVSYSVLSLTLKLLVYRALFRSEFFVCRTAVLGTGEKARDNAGRIQAEYVLPLHKVVAFVRLPGRDGLTEPHDMTLDGVPIIESDRASLSGIIRTLGVSLIILAPEDDRDEKVFYPQLRRLRFDGVEVLSPLAVAEIYSGKTPLSEINEDFLMQASSESGAPSVHRVKRLMDIMFSLTSLIFLGPLLLLIALLIKVTAPRSPVFYSQVRVGQFGDLFTIHKFRTMREGAEGETGAVWATARDPRITWIGGFLRRFRLDETPQFLNILRSEMSLVGPRPERPELTERLEKEIPFFPERENVVPGLTGWAQIRHPYGESVEDAARKFEYDLYYIKHLSLSLDVQIILSTIRIVLFGMERVEEAGGPRHRRGSRDGSIPSIM